MMSLKASLLLLLGVIVSVILIHSCDPSAPAPSVEEPSEIVESDILPHLKELADDKYMGRMPFGPGDPMSVACLLYTSDAADE